MRKTFIRNAKVFPFAKLTGWKPSPHLYRKIFGGTEIICGITLVAIPGPLKDAANVVMLFMMMFDVYSHWALNEGLDKMSLSIVFLLLLTCRLIVYLQIKAREVDEVKQGEEKSKDTLTENPTKESAQVKKDQ